MIHDLKVIAKGRGRNRHVGIYLQKQLFGNIDYKMILIQTRLIYSVQLLTIRGNINNINGIVH